MHMIPVPRRSLPALFALSFCVAPLAAGQGVPLGGFDEYVTQAMRDWKRADR